MMAPTMFRRVTGAALPLLLLVGTSSVAQTGGAPPIDEGMPWSFVVESAAGRGPAEIGGVKHNLAWRWRSVRPYARNRQGRWYLSFELARFDFPDAKAAAAALDTVIPKEIETGIWEYFALDDAHLWHRVPSTVYQTFVRPLLAAEQTNV